MKYDSRRIDSVSHGAFLDATEGRQFVWLRPDGPDVYATGAAATVRAAGPGRFDAVEAELRERFGDLEPDGSGAAAPRAVGGFSFFDRQRRARYWSGFPAAEMVIPRVQVVRDGETRLTVVARRDEDASELLEAWADRLADPPEGAGSIPSPTGYSWVQQPEEWRRGVDRAASELAESRGKAVLSQAVELAFDDELPVRKVLARLRESYPECVTFLYSPPNGRAFFGATPETLVSKRGRRLDTEALAGSVTPDGSEAPETLLRDPKYDRENSLVAEYIAEQLAPVASDVSIHDPEIKRLKGLRHLRRPITATAAGGTNVLSFCGRLHPTPAVAGVPVDAAMEIIREVEAYERGWYASPVGWASADGDGEFAVGIRSGVAGDGSLMLFGGAGILPESDSDAEWGEVTSRFEPILDALGTSLPSEI